MKKLVIAFVAISAVAAQGAFITGDIYNVDYGTANGIASGAGVVGSAGDTWNAVNSQWNVGGPTAKADGTSVNISNWSDGSAGSIGGTPGIWGPNGGTEALMGDYRYIQDNSTNTAFVGGVEYGTAQRITIYDNTMTDLNQTQPFNLTLFGSSNTGDGFKVLVKQNDGTGDTFVEANVTGGIWGGTFIDGVNYTTINDIKATSAFGGNGAEFEIWLVGDLADNNTNSYVALNGLQLEAVPEPATLAFIGLFGAFTYVRRRFMI